MERGTPVVLALFVMVLLVPESSAGRKSHGGRSPTHRSQSESTESFPLDFSAVQKGNVDTFLGQVTKLAQSLYSCSAHKLDGDMKLHLLANSSVTCNDGTPAGYYLKRSHGSRRWLLFLEGGWYCFNKQNCDLRYDTVRRLMSSTTWPQTRMGTGILSPQPEENPQWWNANIVFIPYCSSDVWSGTSLKTNQSDYAFMGSLIIQEIVKGLLIKGLDNAKVLLLAGSSAGGTGVVLNVDRVAELLKNLGHKSIQVRGLVDSGWFLDNMQNNCTDCVDTMNSAPIEAIKKGIGYWGSVVPECCGLAYTGEEWNCFFGYKVYPTLKSPMFVMQWLFDKAQLTFDNIHFTGQPMQLSQWHYVQNLGTELRKTLKDVSAMFVPACLAHEILTRGHWMRVQVKGTSLPRALQCWDHSLRKNGSHRSPPRMCPLQLIDSCPWPQCNPTCPTVRNPITGREMGVTQFLKHMGFDVELAAQQQGMDADTLLALLNNGN